MPGMFTVMKLIAWFAWGAADLSNPSYWQVPSGTVPPSELPY